MAYLWLIRFPPYAPLRGGAHDYSRALIESLGAQAEVNCLAFAEAGVTAPVRAGVSWRLIEKPRRSIVRAFLSPLPNVAARNVSAAYLAAAIEMARGADAVFVDFIAMAWVIAPLRRALADMPGRPPVIMVTHNHEHAVRRQMVRAAGSLPMRGVLALDAAKAGRLERRALAAADGATAITAADAKAFAGLAATPVQVVPPVYAGPVCAQRRIDGGVPRAMTILGNRGSQHKAMVLDRTLRVLAAHGLDRVARVEVAGGDIPATIGRAYPGFPVVGFVEDLAAYAGTIRLGLLTDDIGGGFKIRAMSYAMLRVPMLALRAAMEGMEFEDGVHFIGVDTLDELAEVAKVLIDDLDRLNALQETAFAFARERFRPEAGGDRLLAIVARARA